MMKNTIGLFLMCIILLPACTAQQIAILDFNESNITVTSDLEIEATEEQIPGKSTKELILVSANGIECSSFDDEIGGRTCSGAVTLDINRELPIGTKMTACIGYQGKSGGHSGCVAYGSVESTKSPPGRVTFQLFNERFAICPPPITFVEIGALGDRIGPIEWLNIPVKCA